MVKYRKALVTGGAGFIGSKLSKKLLERGLDVYVIDNLANSSIEKLPSGVNFIKGSVLDIKQVRDIVSEGIEIVFHNAAKVTIRGSVEDFYSDGQNNIMGTLSLLTACSNSKVKKIVYASSMAVYGDSEKPIPINEDYKKTPISPYGISKLVSEMYIENICASLGIKYIILRYFNTYGPGQTFTPYVGVITIFINKLLNGEPLVVFGDGKQCRDFIYVDDIVEGNIRAMETDINSGTFNIGSGRGNTINDVANVLTARLNGKLDIVYSDSRAEELVNSVADISRATNILGYKPSFIFPDNIEEVIEFIKNS